MKNILFVAHFCNDFDIEGNNRFNYLSGLLSNRNNVEFLTTTFSHRKKTNREKVNSYQGMKVTMLEEPGYRKNVSLARLKSHRVFGKNLKRYLQKIEQKPDVIYCAVPSLDCAASAVKYAKQNNIKIIIDIQDLWPEAFQMVLNIPLIFYPMRKKADYIYKNADEITAVSKTYLNRAGYVNKNVKEDNVVFIGTNLKQFEENVLLHSVEKNDKEEIWLGYCGSLSKSYDINCVIDAISILNNRGYKKIKFYVMGDGGLRQFFEENALSKGVNADFMGYVPYPQMCGILSSCDIAINPIVAGSAGSIINKHADYAAAGIPVVNSQECQEYRDLIEEYCMGCNCKNSDAEDMADKIELLIKNPQMRADMGGNARKCAKEKFDRNYTYQKIINMIESL